MRRDKLEKAVASLRSGNTTAQRIVLRELSWLVGVFVKKLKSRHGSILGAQEYWVNVRHAIIESAALCPLECKQWSEIKRKTLRDIELRISDRLGGGFLFNKRAVYESMEKFAVPRHYSIDPVVIRIVRKHKPKSDIAFASLLGGGASLGKIAQKKHVSRSRVVARRKRFIARMHEILSKHGIHSLGDAYTYLGGHDAIK